MDISGKRHVTNKIREERKMNRMRGCDYSQPGYYYITVCVKDRIERFGEVVDGEMALNGYGKTAEHYWMEIPRHYENMSLDRFIIMPNHIHGITQTACTDKSSKNVSIPQIIKSFKSGDRLLSMENLQSGTVNRAAVFPRKIAERGLYAGCVIPHVRTRRRREKEKARSDTLFCLRGLLVGGTPKGI